MVSSLLYTLSLCFQNPNKNPWEILKELLKDSPLGFHEEFLKGVPLESLMRQEIRKGRGGGAGGRKGGGRSLE